MRLWSAVVELVEGIRVVTLLRDTALADLRAGLEVRAEFEGRADGTAVVVFVPASLARWTVSAATSTALTDAP